MLRAFSASSACWMNRRAVSYCARPSLLSEAELTRERSRVARPSRSRIAATVCDSDPGVGVSVSDGAGDGRAADSTGSGECRRRFRLLLRPRRAATAACTGRAGSTAGVSGNRLRLRRIDRDDARRRRRRIEQRHLRLGPHLRLRGARAERRRQQHDRATTRIRASHLVGVAAARQDTTINVVPYPDRGFDVDLAVVDLDRPIHHRQADAGAAFLGRVIQLENLRQVLRRDADPCIFDAHADAAVWQRRAADGQPPALRHGLDRVLREVEERVAQLRRVAFDQQRRRRCSRA